jgi:hypothetical protein
MCLRTKAQGSDSLEPLDIGASLVTDASETADITILLICTLGKSFQTSERRFSIALQGLRPE